MKLLFIFLVLINVLYAGWNYIKPVSSINALPPLAGNLKRLELLDESNGVELNRFADEQVSVPVEEKAQGSIEESSTVIVTQAMACFTLGPFKDESILQQVKSSLAQYVKDISVRKREESEKHRYWVHIPALSNRAEAKKKASELRRKKLKDFYVVLNGESKNSISLGHFREPLHANRRMKRVQDMGFDAEINVIYRNYDVFWLDYLVYLDEVSPGFDIQEYIAEGVSQVKRDCDS